MACNGHHTVQIEEVATVCNFVGLAAWVSSCVQHSALHCEQHCLEDCCCLQTFWAKSIEDRAKVDLKLHFMKKTLNEVVNI